ncbi:hypothetical protein [Mucilaginibacter ginsenosidivorans]|uniref:DUF2007 domain-containing protein n=1 Tax=Mucilaginibacter ginsenosidivorans TaxID=398053 RepID=A0A5B8URS7_9SPHI|nr:hypothetical protein [Mucilaginibacter ginsenosidivorans]QEC61780.1 hypothetical protein FRZ54_04000 [Mucilaginibacter ginsenosidivorans]
MEPEFITYQKFNDAALAAELTAILDGNHIEYLIQEETSGFDPSFVMSNAAVDYAVKIKGKDFEKVNQLLVENEERRLDEVDKDYYLFTFTNDELMEVITKADEWSVFDVVLARKILTDRGDEITKEKLSEISEHRIEDLKTPEKKQTIWILVGYAIALSGILLPIFLIFVGVFIGWHLFSYKKTLPDGERVYGYTERDRWHGRCIFYLSIVVFLASLIYLIFIRNT